MYLPFRHGLQPCIYQAIRRIYWQILIFGTSGVRTRDLPIQSRPRCHLWLTRLEYWANSSWILFTQELMSTDLAIFQIFKWVNRRYSWLKTAKFHLNKNLKKILLCSHRSPSGKQRLPFPVFLSLPQSAGLSSSRPVATGASVPPPTPKLLLGCCCCWPWFSQDIVIYFWCASFIKLSLQVCCLFSNLQHRLLKVVCETVTI